jgi:putative SOS response-associated peptidase YedK
MCGRFALYLQAGAFAEIFGCAPPDDLPPRYNIVPDGGIVAVVQGPAGRKAGRLCWGLLPPWAEAPDDRGRQINARSDTVFDKPSFRSAALRHRCLIPASGFFEWQKGDGASRPYFIHSTDGAPIAMAGIWRQSRFGESAIATCAILTMDAYPSIAGIHHRMPVMLHPAAWDAWLDPTPREAATLRRALQPLPEALIAAHEVSRAVNSPANDRPDLVEPVAETAPTTYPPTQGALF